MIHWKFDLCWACWLIISSKVDRISLIFLKYGIDADILELSFFAIGHKSKLVSSLLLAFVIWLSSMILMGLLIWIILIRHHFYRPCMATISHFLWVTCQKWRKDWLNPLWSWNLNGMNPDRHGKCLEWKKICILAQSWLSMSNIVLEFWF